MSMKQDSVNKVRLDGCVVGCKIVSDGPKRLVADLVFVTNYRRKETPGEAPASERLGSLKHPVRVVLNSEDALSADLRELASRESIRTMEVFRLDGSLHQEAETGYVLVGRDGMRRTDAVTIGRNNRFEITGLVKSIGVTDESARVVVRCGRESLTSFVSKESCPKEFETIRSGKIRKGDVLSMRGPLVPQRFTDGKSNFVLLGLMPDKIVCERLVREQKAGVTL